MSKTYREFVDRLNEARGRKDTMFNDKKKWNIDWNIIFDAGTSTADLTIEFGQKEISEKEWVRLLYGKAKSEAEWLLSVTTVAKARKEALAAAKLLGLWWKPNV